MADITITYPAGVHKLDALPDGSSRLCFLASFLTINEMRRLFVGDDAKEVCTLLGIEYTSRDSEKVLCTKIWSHFNEPAV